VEPQFRRELPGPIVVTVGLFISVECLAMLILLWLA
jgi:hypothetical protein